MKTTIILASLALATLGGCASNDQMTSKIDSLSSQVQGLSQQVSELKAQQDKNTKAIEEAKMSAKHAAMMAEKTDERVDNMVASFKK
ncbi:Lpp/OprI family alanine-zipper lipoprotein [Colwellia sp. MEBiC06753]